MPYNIFQRGPNGESLVSQAALDYVQGIGITTGQTEQKVFGGNIQTDLGRYGVQSPMANEGVLHIVSRLPPLATSLKRFRSEPFQ